MQEIRRIFDSHLMSRAFALLLLCSVMSCKRDPALFQIRNLNGNDIGIFGHAGMGQEFMYPIDTYESIEPLLRIGADGSEMDIQLTRDSILVLYHNNRIEEMMPCTSGLINEKYWWEIWGCHLASPISSKVKLVSFDELMAQLQASGKNVKNYTFTFDCKLYRDWSRSQDFLKTFARAIAGTAKKHGIAERLFVESQDTSLLRTLQEIQTGMRLFYYPPDFGTGLRIAGQMGLYGITLHYENVGVEQTRTAHEAGLRVTLWGINSETENVEALKKNPDYVQTDKPIHLLMLLNRLIRD